MKFDQDFSRPEEWTARVSGPLFTFRGSIRNGPMLARVLDELRVYLPPC